MGLKKTMLFLLIALVFTVTVCYAQEDQPVIVYQGQTRYTVSEAEAYLEQTKSDYSESLLSEADAIAMRDYVIEMLRDQVILEEKYIEFGLDHIDPDEEALLYNNAKNAYEKMEQDTAQQLQQLYGGTIQDAADTAKALLKQTGGTLEYVLEQVTVRWKSQRLLEYTVGECAVSEDEIETTYYTQYVETSRLKYENNYAGFEKDVLMGNEQSYWYPEGIRLVQWITLPMEPETVTAVGNVVSQAKKANQELLLAYNAAYGTFESDDERYEAWNAYERAMTAYSEAQASYENVCEQMLEQAQPNIERVIAELQKGLSIDDLIRTCSMDHTTLGKAHPVHLLSGLENMEFVTAAMEIETPGTFGRPVATENGVMLIYYTAPLHGGAVPLSDEMKSFIRESIRGEKQLDALEQVMKTWREEFEIETYPERLTPPEW